MNRRNIRRLKSVWVNIRRSSPFRFALLADELLDLLEDGGIVLVEPPGDLLDIERLAPGRDPAFGIRLLSGHSRAFRLYSQRVRIGSPGPQPNAASGAVWVLLSGVLKWAKR